MDTFSPPKDSSYEYSESDYLKNYFLMRYRAMAFNFRDAVRASKGDPVSAAKLLETITLEVSEDAAAVATELSAIIEGTSYSEGKS
jgi:hypothetical protein